MKKTLKRPKKKTATKKVKKSVRKTSSKVAKSRKAEKPIGKVTHFYRKIKVAVVKFSKSVPVGAKVKFLGASTKFEQKIKSLQVDYKNVKKAPAKKSVGLKVDKKVREGDGIYLVK